MTAARLLLPLGIALLAACAQQPGKQTAVQVANSSDCPATLRPGQQLIVTLSSNPTTGFRWQTKDAASNVLRVLSPEVYSNPEDVGVVGGAGISTWRFQATEPGSGELLMAYHRPWEPEVAPAELFDCPITVK
ncbi:MAG: protease inhibitor I42 family protein [Pseudomonas sp.]